MHTINRILMDMPLVIERAAQLRCEVVAVLGNVILCYRSDGTYITWKCYLQWDGSTKRAVFDSGSYDMNWEGAQYNLTMRANFRAVIGEQV